MESFLRVNCSVHGRPHQFKLSILDVKHLYRIHRWLEYLANDLVILLIFRRQQSQWFSWSTNSSCSTTSMDIDLSIERALVVKHILHVWNVETSRCNICANQNCWFIVIFLLTFYIAKLNWFRVNLLHCCLEPIQVLEPLSLLHFWVQDLVLDFHEV